MLFALFEILSFFVFGCNFNAIGAAAAATAAIATASVAVYIPLSAAAVVVAVDISYFLLYFPNLFTNQLTFLP